MGPLLAAAAGVAGGTALGLERAGLAWPLSIVAVAAIAATVFVGRDRAAALAAVVVALTCGAGASAAWRSVGARDAMLPQLARRHVLVEACGLVRLRRPRSIEIRAEEVVVGRARWSTHEPLRIGGRRARSVFPGRRICARGPVSPPRPGRDEAPLLSARTLRSSGSGSAVRAAATRVRREYSKAARAALPPTQAGLLLGATVGIVVWGERLAERVRRLFRRETRVVNAIASGLGTTIAAQLAVAPLLAWHFGRIPGLGAVANVVAIPLGGMVMVGGMATLTAASVVPFLDWTPSLMRLPLDVILGAAHFFSELPSASIAVSTAAAVAITGALAAFLSRPGRIRTGLFALVVVCGGVAGGQNVAGGAGCPGPAVYALDVGQGSAVVLRSRGHAVLVDAGPADGDAAGKLKAAGIDRLDAIIVMHPHIDHALGAIRVLESMPVGHVYGPVTLGWGSGSDVIDYAEGRGVPVDMLAAGDELDLGSIAFGVLWPEPGPAPAFDEDLVDPYSLVLRAEVEGVSVLLPGDIRAEQQSELVDADVDVPLLIAVHHGSKNLDVDFVDAVSPALTLVTVGAPNPYGLPAPEAIRAYARHGAVFRTDQDGRVGACLDGGRAEVVTEK